MKMKKSSVAVTILTVPCSFFIYIPAIILWIGYSTTGEFKMLQPSDVAFWLTFCIGAFGLILFVWSGVLLFSVGKGTPAPWDPPQQLVVQGPYKCMRNPMVIGGLLLLFAESLFFHSWPLAGWLVVVWIGAAIFVTVSEERGLRKTFKDEYTDYCEHVPRWIPNVQCWENHSPSEPDDQQES